MAIISGFSEKSAGSTVCKLFEHTDVKYRGISVEYIDSYERSYTNTMEAIKINLIEKNKKYANPATYAIETDITFPYDESFLPIAKRYLVKHVA